MNEQRFFLKSNSLKGLEKAVFSGRAVLDDFEQINHFFQQNRLINGSFLFAKPFLSEGQNHAQVVSWYGATSGTALSWAELDEETRNRVQRIIKDQIMIMRPLFSHEKIGPILQRWLNIVDINKDLLLVGNRPILTNWGLLPNAVSSNAQKRKLHFHDGFGAIIGIEDIPPFSDGDLSHLDYAEGITMTSNTSDDNGNKISDKLGQNTKNQNLYDQGVEQDHNQEANPHSTNRTVYHEPVLVTTRQSNYAIPLIACVIAFVLVLFLLLAFFLPQKAANVGITSSAEDEAITLLEKRRDALREGITSFQCAIPNQSAQGGGAGHAGSGGAPVPGPQAAIPPSLLLPSAGPIDHAEKATVLILTISDDEEDQGSMGTGFFINETDIVTNLHVVGNAEDATIINKAFGGAMKAKVIARSRNEAEIGAPDFAVLRLQDAKAPAILSVAASIAKGDNIIAAGFPGVIMETDTTYQRLMQGDMTAAPEMAVTQGMVTTFQQGVDGLELLLHTAAISGGNSGGPLLDYCGRVVGVNTFLRSGTAQHSPLSFAQRSASLAHFLKSSNVSFQYDSNACSPQQPGAHTPSAPPAPDQPQATPENDGANGGSANGGADTQQAPAAPIPNVPASNTSVPDTAAPATDSAAPNTPAPSTAAPSTPAPTPAMPNNNAAPQDNPTSQNYNPFTQRRSPDDRDLSDQQDDE